MRSRCAFVCLFRVCVPMTIGSHMCACICEKIGIRIFRTCYSKLHSGRMETRTMVLRSFFLLLCCVSPLTLSTSLNVCTPHTVDEYGNGYKIEYCTISLFNRWMNRFFFKWPLQVELIPIAKTLSYTIQNSLRNRRISSEFSSAHYFPKWKTYIRFQAKTWWDLLWFPSVINHFIIHFVNHLLI